MFRILDDPKRSTALALALIGGFGTAFALFADRFDRPTPADGEALVRYGFYKGSPNSVLRPDGSAVHVRNYTGIHSADCRSDLPAGLPKPAYAIYTCVVRFTDEGGCEAYAVFNAQPRSPLQPKINGYTYGHWSVDDRRNILRQRGLIKPGANCKA
jgi:hypothetical protein